MKLQILKENLLKAAGTVARYSSTKTQMPALSYVFIDATKEGIFFLATNLEISVRLRVSGKVVEEGAVVVPAKLLSELVEHLPLGVVELSLDGSSLSVLAGKVKARLQVGAIDDFPPFGAIGERIGKVSVGVFRKMLDFVGFSASIDESRPVLTGILCEFSSNRLVTTDGYRLSVLEGLDGLELVKGAHESLLLPSKGLLQALQSFDDWNVSQADFCFDTVSQQLFIVAEELYVSLRVLGGTYPQYGAIMPKASAVEVLFDRLELLEAVKSVAIFARDSASIVKLSLENEVLSLSANTALVGENVVEVEGEVVKAGKVSIAFNSRYLVDFLTHLSTERVGVGFSDGLKPGLFYGAGQKNYQHVIMPVRVRDAA